MTVEEPAGAPAGPALLSVGYEGRDLAELVGLLREHGVTVLVDVRLNAISRKPGLSKTRLAAAMAEAGIGYRHARALGNPKDNRAAFSAADPGVGVRAFRALLAGDDARRELDQLAELLRTERLAVLCVERDHDRCHRQVVVEALSGGRPVVRLD